MSDSPPPARSAWRVRGSAVWVTASRPGGYVANVARLATGTGLAQVVALGQLPLLTRLYTPSQFGLAASFSAIIAVVGPAAALRYDIAVVLPEHDRDAAQAFWLGIVLVVTVSAVLLGLAVLWNGLPAGYRHPLGSLVLLLPVSVLGVGGNSLLSAWATRKREFGIIGRSRVLAAVLAAGVALAGGWALQPTVGVLVAAAVTGALVPGVALLVGLRRRRVLPPGAGVSAAGMRAAAVEHRQFPFFNLPMALTDQITASLPVLTFTGWFGAATAAYFSLANSALRAPVGLLGQSVGQVFYERAARAHDRPAEMRRLVRTTGAALALLSLLPLVVVLGFGPPLFAFVFGGEWRGAGVFAQYLVVAVCLSLVASPLSMLPTVLRKQNVHLWFVIVGAAARVVSLAVGARLGSATAAVALYSAAEAVGLVAFILWLAFAIGKNRAPAAPSGVA